MHKRCLVSLLWLACAAHAGAAQVADYQFQNGLQSAIAGAPALSALGAGTAFATELVRGEERTVLTYAMGSGVALTPTASILPGGDAYTIVMLVRHEQNDKSTNYSKYIDFAEGTLDEGLYENGKGFLEFYPYESEQNVLIGSDYVEIAVTRDANGVLKGYVDGVPSFSADDSIDGFGVISAAETLRFFVDDEITKGNEASSGAVARIRIWDTALSAEEIATLDKIFVDGFDS